MPRVRPYKFLQGTSRTPTTERGTYRQLQTTTVHDPPVPWLGTFYRACTYATFTDDASLSDTTWGAGPDYHFSGYDTTYVMDPVRYTPTPDGDNDNDHRWPMYHLRNPGHKSGLSQTLPTGSHFESTDTFTITLPNSLYVKPYSGGTSSVLQSPNAHVKLAHWRLRKNGTAVSGPHDVTSQTSPTPVWDNSQEAYYAPGRPVTTLAIDFTSSDGITIDHGDLIEVDLWYNVFTGNVNFGGNAGDDTGLTLQFDDELDAGYVNPLTHHSYSPIGGMSIFGFPANDSFDPSIHTYQLENFGAANNPGSDPFKMVPGTEWKLLKHDSTQIHMRRLDTNATTYPIQEIKLSWDKELAELWIWDKDITKGIYKRGLYYRPDSSTTTDYHPTQDKSGTYSFHDVSAFDPSQMGIFDGSGFTAFGFVAAGFVNLADNSHHLDTRSSPSISGTYSGSITVTRVNI